MGKAKCAQLQDDIKEREQKHLNAMRDKVKLQEGLQMKLETMKTELAEIKEKFQNYTELEKRNSLLKDKIERQDNYLKKKLQQERQKKLAGTNLPQKTSTVAKFGNDGRRSN